MENNNPHNFSLKLESLKNEFSLAIIEYDNAYKDIMDLIKQSGVSLKQINNSELIGTEYKSTYIIDNVADCLDDCINDKTCSGLDYIQENNKCIFYTDILGIKKNNNHTSYIKNINSVYLVLAQINTRLNNIILEINELMDKEDPITKNDIELKKEEIYKLNLQYKTLQEQTDTINHLINKNDDLTNEYNITTLMINRSRFVYLLWVLLLIIIIICIIKYVFYS
jgi:mannose/fructose-specific phosphotransferase system component IIA